LLDLAISESSGQWSQGFFSRMDKVLCSVSVIPIQHRTVLFAVFCHDNNE